MKKLGMAALISLLLAFTASTAFALPTLYDWAFNLNGAMVTAPATFSGPDPGQLPGYVDDTGFDWNTGLGKVTMAFSPGVADNYFFIAFFDHEFVEPGNSFFNEFGAANGATAAGQSWEIDEPGYMFGDIRTYWELDGSGNLVEYTGNVEKGALDNTNNVPEGSEDDVSMALGWDFSLELDKMAVIDFILSDIIPTEMFYLAHTDSASNETVYFSSRLNVRDVAPIPEPGTMMLLTTGLIGFLGLRKKWSKRK